MWVKVKGQVVQAQFKGDTISRWAHVNVKLHFLHHLWTQQSYMLGL